MESGSLPIDDSPSEVTTLKSDPSLSWKALLFVAASIAFVVVAARWAYLERQADKFADRAAIAREGEATNADGQEPTSQGIALVTRLGECTMARPVIRGRRRGRAHSRNSETEIGIRGQVEFFCGASVVLEGPAELELVSSTAARFLRGRLRAQVPPAARGFQIDVDGMKVVDLGTEFGLSVSPAGSDVQVFDGEIELHREGSQRRTITAGQAFSHDSGVLTSAKVTPNQYVDLAALDSHAKDQTDSRFARWQAYSQRLRGDDRLIAYYAPDQADRWQRKLKNSALPANSDLDGAIVGARRVSGRWTGKGALEFKQPGDRVRVNIPGEFRSLTFACWVKIDSLDRWYNSLFLTDNYQRGEPHWQILDSGQLFFSVRVSREQGGPEHSGSFVSDFLGSGAEWKMAASRNDLRCRCETDDALPERRAVNPGVDSRSSNG